MRDKKAPSPVWYTGDGKGQQMLFGDVTKPFVKHSTNSDKAQVISAYLLDKADNGIKRQTLERIPGITEREGMRAIRHERMREGDAVKRGRSV